MAGGGNAAAGQAGGGAGDAGAAGLRRRRALEGWVRALHEMRPQLGRTAEIFIVDCGLSTEGMRRAELLTRRFPKVTVLEREELEQIIE